MGGGQDLGEPKGPNLVTFSAIAFKKKKKRAHPRGTESLCTQGTTAAIEAARQQIYQHSHSVKTRKVHALLAKGLRQAIACACMSVHPQNC